MICISLPPGARAIAAGLLSFCLAAPALAAGPGVPHRSMMDKACERMSERLARIDRDLSVDQVRDVVEGRIAMSGEKTLKVGKVSENDGIVHVDIVTKEGSLVLTREISPKTGLPADASERCERVRDRASHFRDKHPSPRHPAALRGHPGRSAHGRGLALWIIAAQPGQDLHLTAAQAKSLAEAALVLAGNPRLKVGDVKEKDADTISIDIVTQDNAVALKRGVDRHTGRFRRAT